jgi:hypothetical protein
MYTLEDGSQVNKIPYNYTGSSTNEDGIKAWYQDGKLHRLDGPAIEVNDSKAWYQYGKLHRLEGPAWEMADGSKEWWINGKQITKTTRIVCLF